MDDDAYLLDIMNGADGVVDLHAPAPPPLSARARSATASS